MRRRGFLAALAALGTMGTLAEAKAKPKPEPEPAPSDNEICVGVIDEPKFIFPESKYMGKITSINITTNPSTPMWDLGLENPHVFPSETILEIVSSTGKAAFTAFNYEHRHNVELYARLQEFCDEVDATLDRPKDAPYSKEDGLVVVAGIEFKMASYRITKPL